MITGSCLCGGIAFEIAAATEFRNCHCSRCRKSRGAAFASNMFVKPADFRWVRGEELLIHYRLPKTARFGNAFCGVCGSPMPRLVPALDTYVVAAGALDSDPGIEPAYHIFVGSKAPWHRITDALPRHAEYHPKS